MTSQGDVPPPPAGPGPAAADRPAAGARAVDPAAIDLRLSVMRLARRLRAQRLPGDLPLGCLSALGRLERDGDATTSELATAERITPQSMARSVAELVRRGLVGRAADPADGRQTLLHITDAGREYVALDRRRRDAWLSRAMAEHLTDVERDLLLVAGRLLDRLAASPTSAPEPGGAPAGLPAATAGTTAGGWR